jgi:aspartate-semialdehyde dehydrogenase
LQDDSIAVNATCVRIPVFYGHSEAVHIETRQPLSVDDARALLSAAPGLTLLGDHELATPVEHGAGTDPVFVSRLRKDISHPNGLNLWVVADNVRKGAALNSVQIAELLLAHL